MPDIDEHQRLINENLKYSLQEQQYLKVINNLIPDIWGEIGKIQINILTLLIVLSNKVKEILHMKVRYATV